MSKDEAMLAIFMSYSYSGSSTNDEYLIGRSSSSWSTEAPLQR